jgi:hypothetical protein
LPADPSVDDIDVALTVPTVPMTTTATIAKPKANVMKEWTLAENEDQNQKRPARWVAEWARKSKALVAALEEKKRERLVLMHARA